MKKTIGLFLATTLFAIAVNAQQAPPPPPEGKPMMSKEEHAKMKKIKEAELAKTLKEVGATDDQISQAKTAMEETGKKMKELRGDASLSDDDKKAKLKEIKEAQEAKMKEILGVDKFKQFKEKKKAEMKAMMPHDKDGKPASMDAPKN